MAWGQFTDHDITLTAEIDEVLEEDLNCCTGFVVVEIWSRYAVTTIFYRPKRDTPYVFSNRGKKSIEVKIRDRDGDVDNVRFLTTITSSPSTASAA